MTGLRMIKRYNCDQYFRPYKDMRPEAKNRWGRRGKRITNNHTAEQKEGR
jgi:hypothetical protein